MAKLNKRRAASLLEQAGLHGQRGEWDKVEALAREVAYGSALPEAGFTLLSEALLRLDRRDEAKKITQEGLSRFPTLAELNARMGTFALEADDAATALSYFAKAKKELKREPSFLIHHAAALLRAGYADEAHAELTQAVMAGGGHEARLLLAVVKGRLGQIAEAEELAAQAESATTNDVQRAAAQALRADAKLLLGESAEALKIWKHLEAQGLLEGPQLSHVAWAAQLQGDTATAEALIARRLPAATGEDRLLFARVALVRGQAAEALAHLDAAQDSKGERFPGWELELLGARGRALRMLGRRDEAAQVLAAAAERPEAKNPRLGATIHVELGHLAAEAQDFEAAEAAFSRALELDPNEPEATRAKALNARRVAWKEEVAGSAQARVEAARAELEAQRRRVVAREGEVERLRRELEALRAEKASAEAEAKKAAEAARAAGPKAVQAERKSRDEDIEGKAQDSLALALGAQRSSCPEAIAQMLLVAERTYQTALYMDLPAAAVAVLFSGALERSLFFLLVTPFDEWLSQGSRRADFLARAVREQRGHRVEYFDRFVEAFDKDLEAQAPSLGEVGRVLERRGEAYLAPWVAFLQARYQLPDAFYGELASFVRWAKEKLRDPVAHGRAIELKYEELNALREQLLFKFAGGAGLVARFLEARR